MVGGHGVDHGSRWAAIQSIAPKIGCTAETLRRWVREAEQAMAPCAEARALEAARVKALEREVRELRQASEILSKGVPMDRQWSERHWRTRILQGGARPPIEAMIAFLDDHRVFYGVEPVRRLLPIARRRITRTGRGTPTLPGCPTGTESPGPSARPERTYSSSSR